ncbi:MAG: DUF58 domain-containing protein [Pseudogulbenkiania sp.]|nr:DUF58 domain-containing protein [Pseudogulbenkiania sp.]
MRFRNRLQAWLIRRQPESTEWTLRQQRIYLLPTTFGWTLLGVALAIWVGALNYAVSLAYALSFWIIGLLLVSVLMAYRQLAGLTLQAGAADPVFAGETAHFEVRLDNPSAWPRTLQGHLAGRAERAVGCQLPSRSSTWLSLPMTAEKRGLQAMPALALSSDVPFGLIRAFAYVRLREHVLVYPAPLRDGLRHGQGASGEGEAVLPAGEDEFSHLAAYRDGDTSRQIAWKVLARRDVLASKQFTGATAAGCRLLDWHDYPPGQGVESRLSWLAWRVLECERERCCYRLRLPGVEVGPQPHQRERALALLARFGALS